MTDSILQTDKNTVVTFVKKPFVAFVLVPFLLFALYQILIASDRFVSQAKLIVKEPDSAATLDTSLALLSGFGVSSGSSDTELVKAFIHSNDMLQFLDAQLSISEHYTDRRFDIFSRLDTEPTKEELLEYFKSHVEVAIDETSQVISIEVQAFDSAYAHKMNQTIVARAEWFINEIGHNLAKEQLRFIQQEHQLVDERLRETKSRLLAFQRRHNLLNPEAEGMALQEITYRLEAQLAAKQTQLRLLRSSMSASAPLVVQTQAEIDSLQEQLNSERARLSQQAEQDPNLPDDEQNLSVSQILAKFSEFKIDLELALQAYASSQVSLEKSRIEAYRQLKYLVTIESPTQPEEALYPNRVYNIALFLVLNILAFGICRVFVATVNELRR
ncbi:lipopolysaccharide biosynthesis protein [Alteromonas flava]|uniref:lipopolysaccharide biosynthesis protein n=1 Tax=Alteromonas flava TaxID=2048003 RepID=UPI000C28BBCB|nr:lipopolysaccharide biosynthesis protein [Alteromonas flava]